MWSRVAVTKENPLKVLGRGFITRSWREQPRDFFYICFFCGGGGNCPLSVHLICFCWRVTSASASYTHGCSGPFVLVHSRTCPCSPITPQLHHQCRSTFFLPLTSTCPFIFSCAVLNGVNVFFFFCKYMYNIFNLSEFILLCCTVYRKQVNFLKPSSPSGSRR